MGMLRTAASLLTISTLALGFVLADTAAEASPASPLACTSPSWSDKDKHGSGTVITYEGTAPMHSGPNSGCPIIDTMFSGDILFYHCYTVNSSGNSWTDLRLAGTQIQGWVWDEYLTDHGSDYSC